MLIGNEQREDNFFIIMKVLKEGGKVIFEKKAVAEENITGNIKEKFKRKARIVSGNFRNSALFCFS